MQKNIWPILLMAGIFMLQGLSSPARAAPEVGQPVSQLMAMELDKSWFQFELVRGKVVIVHFWATWCPSCREEMDALDSFYRTYHPRGVEMIAISMDKLKKRDDVTEVAKSLSFPVAMIDEVTDNDFGKPDQLPVTYVIDRDGIVRARLTPADQVMTANMLGGMVEVLLNTPQNGK